MKVALLLLERVAVRCVELDLPSIPMPGNIVRDVKGKAAYLVTADPAVIYPTGTAKVDAVVFVQYKEIGSQAVQLADSWAR